MAYPFKTPEGISGRPVAGGMSISVTTDAAHATACSARFHIERLDEAQTEAYTDEVSSSGGSVQEKLVCTITDRTPDGHYRATLEYEEVAGSDTWVTDAGVTLDFWISPSSSGTARIVWMTDHHLTPANLADSESDRYVRHSNAVAAVISQKAHLCVSLGDQNVDSGVNITSQAEADAWALAYRAINADLLAAMPYAQINGNHEEIDNDGAGTDIDTYQRSMHADFFLNPVDNDAAGEFWSIVLGPAHLLGIEGYTQSGFNETGGDVDTIDDWDISESQKTMLATELAATTCPFVFLNTHQNWGGASAYGVGGGTNRVVPGTYMRTLHEVLKAAKQANSNIKQIIVMLGHDHLFEHVVIDDIHYVAVASTAQRLGRRNATVGYITADGGPTANSGFIPPNTLYGIVRATVTTTLCTLEFVQTSNDDKDALNAVLHTLKLGVGPAASLRPGGLRRKRRAA